MYIFQTYEFFEKLDWKVIELFNGIFQDFEYFHPLWYRTPNSKRKTKVHELKMRAADCAVDCWSFRRQFDCIDAIDWEPSEEGLCREWAEADGRKNGAQEI